eukprot:m.16917 g.16917  ORF g.16917 m.16917 type:complete len:78 (+) comp10626_c1_seq1:100-333(+)
MIIHSDPPTIKCRDSFVSIKVSCVNSYELVYRSARVLAVTLYIRNGQNEWPGAGTWFDIWLNRISASLEARNQPAFS